MASATSSTKTTCQQLSSILQEIDKEIDVQELEERSTVTSCESSSVQIVPDFLKGILQEIADDNAMPADYRSIAEKCQGQVEDLSAALGFLPDCLYTKSKFVSAAKEASWGRCYQAILTNTTDLNNITKSPPFSSWFCLKVFACLLNETFRVTTDKTPKPVVEHDPQDDDIVIYIGGSVVAKLKKAAYRITDEEKGSRMDILNQMIDLCADDSTKSMTDVLDRGGLIRLIPQIQAMFIEMEHIFLHMFSSCDTGRLAADRYHRECMRSDLVLCGYYETTYKSIAPETVKLQILNNIIDLYFRIRAHHKCKKYMELYLQKKKLSSKQKALRKTLQM